MQFKIISKNNLKIVIDTFIQKGIDLIAPKWDQNKILLLQKVKSFEEIELNEINTRNSAKEFIFPQVEALYGYKLKKNDALIIDVEAAVKPQILFGVRPCDAAGFAVLDDVFKGDYQDEFYTKRREATTIISISCTNCDDACFCVSLGISPGDTEGSDVVLTPIKDDNYLVEIVTDKGQKIIDANPDLFSEGTADKDALLKSVIEKQGIKFNADEISNWLEKNFEHPLWEKISQQCLGCGVCTFVCPTCHCFDIQDEGMLNKGVRFRSWDGCQSKYFTLHSSGHNPRAMQHQRYRQRIMHKYNYHPKKFNKVLCTGCGRCIRHCPVNINLIQILQMINSERKK